METPSALRTAAALVRGHKLLSLVVAAALVLLIIVAVNSCRARRQAAQTMARDAAEDATDARHEQKAGEQTNEADAHGAKANEAAAERRVAEANANSAEVRRAEADANARQTEERDRSTKEAYEKARNANAADRADLSDSELCAEFRKRGRACPK